MQLTDSSPVRLGNRYRLIAELGSGNFGSAWRAHDEDLDQEVVVKLYASDVVFDAVALEAQHQERIGPHDHVVRVRNVVLEPPRPFVVLDFMPGGSVESRMVNGGVELVRALRWTRHLLLALEKAHSLGIIHRDVKPANLLLDASDQALLADYGISEDTIRKRAASSKFYTPHAAPEMLTGSPSTPQTDVWAAGCTLYRLLTGALPFADPDAILAGGFEPAHRLNPQIPLKLSRVLGKALSVPPAARFGSAREMLDALGRCKAVLAWQEETRARALKCWVSDAGSVRLEATVCHRRRLGTFEVELKKDQGHGLRRRSISNEPSLAKAMAALRLLLVAGVEGQL